MPHPRTAKVRGEVAETAFLHRAVCLGLVVSRPWGDSARYDFVVDDSRRLYRVQVKSVSQAHCGAYEVNAGHGRFIKRAYSRRDIDLLAAYVVPCDAWYLLPVAAFSPRKTVRLFPHRRPRQAQFERFREAWRLLGAR